MFKITGKADRYEWWVTSIIASIVAQVSAVFAVISRLESSSMSWWVFVSLAVLSLVAIWIMLSVTARRFRDCAFSPWLTLTALVPVVGEIFILVVCGFFPTSGKKKHKLVTRVVE